jgi:hypothetical protein
MNLWERLKDIGVLKRDEQPDVSAEALRFKADQAFQQYVDTARFNIIMQLYALSVDDIDGFAQLKRSQMALEGLNDFIDSAIMTERLKNR